VFFCYIAIDYGLPDSSVGSIVAPLIFVFILAYFIACMFCEVFGMGITTIMHCFIADEEMFEPDKRFAESSLRTTWQKTNAAASNNKVRTVQVVNCPNIYVISRLHKLKLVPFLY
jgi:hypothetical protein